MSTAIDEDRVKATVALTQNFAERLWRYPACHRVVGANGALTGYAGGIERKLALLKHEGMLL